MTELLEQVFEKASGLPADLQDVLAREFLQEIEWENQWDKTIEKSQDILNKLANKAMQEYESAETEEMGFDEL